MLWRVTACSEGPGLPRKGAEPDCRAIPAGEEQRGKRGNRILRPLRCLGRLRLVRISRLTEFLRSWPPIPRSRAARSRYLIAESRARAQHLARGPGRRKPLSRKRPGRPLEAKWQGRRLSVVRLRQFFQDLEWDWSGERDRLARALAVDCRTAVVDQVWSRACQMTPSEARGYVWARARVPVHRSTRRLVRQGSLAPRRRDGLVAQATELLVRQVLEAIARDRAASAGHRKAA